MPRSPKGTVDTDEFELGVFETREGRVRVLLQAKRDPDGKIRRVDEAQQKVAETDLHAAVEDGLAILSEGA